MRDFLWLYDLWKVNIRCVLRLYRLTSIRIHDLIEFDWNDLSGYYIILHILSIEIIHVWVIYHLTKTTLTNPPCKFICIHFLFNNSLWTDFSPSFWWNYWLLCRKKWKRFHTLCSYLRHLWCILHKTLCLLHSNTWDNLHK